MDNRQLQIRLGLGAIAISLFLIFIAVPNWVSVPSNVPHIVLSPVFWPYTLAGLMGLTGLGLVATGMNQTAGGPPLNEQIKDEKQGYLRLAAIAVIMVATMAIMSKLGMVWTSMLMFMATVLVLKTRYPVAAFICAVAIPLVLYVFFAHVAGLAIPQGDFVRLP